MLIGFLRGIAVIALVVITFTVILSALIVTQGRRNETRRADAVVVLGVAESHTAAPARAMQLRLDVARDLYRRGSISRIILSASDTTTATVESGRQYLIDQGLPDQALLGAEGGEAAWERLNNVANLARANGIQTVLLVGDAPEMLRSLKIARDAGLDAYGVPVRSAPTDDVVEEGRATLEEAWAYSVYIFARQ
jgi:uncharacterized SAM-binding protein YcdF (DUF218 family)